MLELEEDSRLTIALQKGDIITPGDLITLTDKEIEELKYFDSEGRKENLSIGDLRLLKSFQVWAYYLGEEAAGGPIDWLDETEVSSDEFEEFLQTRFVMESVRFRHACESGTVGIPSMKKRDPVADFGRGVKRDKSHYEVLDNEEDFEDWKRKTVATVHAHQLEHVIDKDYRPKMVDDVDLFKEQNTFFNDILVSKVQTPMGKHFVRECEETRDAREAWLGYIDYMRTSAKAELTIKEILTYLTTEKYDYQSQTTSHEFILNWVEKVRLYDSLTDTSAHFPGDMKNTMLENSLSGCRQFREISTNEYLDISKGNNGLTYEAYLAVAQKVALNIQKMRPGHILRKKLKLPMTTANVHEIYESDDEEEDDYGNCQRCIQRMEINHMRRYKPSLKKTTWDRLSENDKETWDRMTDEGKGVIIKNMSPYKVSDKNENVVVSKVSLDTSQDNEESTKLLEAGRKKENTQNDDIHGGDIRKLMSSSINKGQINTSVHFLTINNEYRVSQSQILMEGGALVDRGTNGGISGSDVRVISTTDKCIDVMGMDNHKVIGLPVVTAGAVVDTTSGEIIVIMNQYALSKSGRTIHSCIQMESYNLQVDEKSSKLAGVSQTITTPSGFAIPIKIINGLAQIKMRQYTDEEWGQLPHEIITSDAPWDPTVADDSKVNQRKGNVEVNWVQNDIEKIREELDVNNIHTNPSQVDYEHLRPFFLHVSKEVIKKTFQATTQFAHSGWIQGKIFNTYISPFPALNVKRRNEAVASDTIYANTPSICGGYTAGQFFVGMTTKVCDIIGVKTDGEFINALEEVIRVRGAMDTIVTDRAKEEISAKVRKLLGHLCIGDWQSDPKSQHQNFSERRYQDVKRYTNLTLNNTGAPSESWFLCIKYILFIMNRTALKSIGWRTPLEMLDGTSPDISMVYRFQFWDKIYFSRDESSGKCFPSESNEEIGRFVGFSEAVGHKMTYMVLNNETNRLLFRSSIRLADLRTNKRLEGDNIVVYSGGGRVDQNDQHMLIIDPEELIGRTYLSETDEDEERDRLKVVELLHYGEEERKRDPMAREFRSTNGDGSYEEIIAYNDLIGKVEDDHEHDGIFKFNSIEGHEGPLGSNKPNYKGSAWNLKILWENGTTMYEPLKLISETDPVTCARYAEKNGLLDKKGWKRFKSLALKNKLLLRMVNQKLLSSYRSAPTYKLGIVIPQTHRQAMELDAEQGNDKWKKAEEVELEQLEQYKVFEDLGENLPTDTESKQIMVRFVYDIKHDGRHKARLVAGGHLTSPLEYSVYSSVVSLRGLRMVIFLSELNNQQLWTTDVGNAYLEADTEEKVHIVAGPEFRDREGHVLVIKKALYGLRSSGRMWWMRSSSILESMGFDPTKAEGDIWFRKDGDKYEYIARYVDDFAIASDDPSKIIYTLEDTHRLVLKGTGPIGMHLGCNFYRDNVGVLCMAPKQYIDRLGEAYYRLFGKLPTTRHRSPLQGGDHPELDTSEFLDATCIKVYQSLVGSLQWIVSIGRLDVNTAVITMASFRTAPREGHLEWLKRIIRYLTKMKDYTIRYRTMAPSHQGVDDPSYEWENTVYKGAEEVLPKDLPLSSGLPVIHTCYVDANLMHD